MFFICPFNWPCFTEAVEKSCRFYDLIHFHARELIPEVITCRVRVHAGSGLHPMEESGRLCSVFQKVEEGLFAETALKKT
jgi:hypothetical protein